MIIAIILSLIALIIIALLVGQFVLSKQFHKEVSELFSQSKNISNKLFNYEQLSGLPKPAQRYFKHVLKEGQPCISYVRLKHNGQFKTAQNKDWVDIEGEQYFTIEKPGLLWKGKTSMFTARDMYIADKGRLVVSFFSLVNIVDAKGEKYNQGELLRWVGESVWFPTNLLPSERLQWTPIDSLTSKLTFKHSGLSVFYIVTFNEIGEITQIETKRYMGGGSLETWIGKFTDYKDMNGIIIPTTIEGVWKLKNGDYSYAKFNVKNIEYNKPEKF